MKNNFLKKGMLFIGFVLLYSRLLSQLNPLTIGTIHAGDSIVIKYNAVINNPLVPPATTQISNQGTVAGSNFSNVLTDDPDSGPPADPTITLLNVFPLPVLFVSVKAFQQSAGIRVEWVTAAEADVERYDIEKSTDGRLFTVIGSVPARGNNSNSNTSYSFNDINVVTGNNIYRIKAVDFTPGAIKYTGTVNVKIGAGKNIFMVAANPLQGNTLILQLQGADKGVYVLSLYNNIGQKITQKTIDHSGGSSSQTIQLGNISRGVYLLKIVNQFSVQTKKIIIQ